MPTQHVNDITLYYEAHGEGEPLVLIPGLSADVSDYARIIAELALHYRVIALDNRGAGRSDKPDILYSIEMMADDAAALLDALGFGASHIVGTSMGGRIAVDLALRHPEHVRSLILVSTAMRPVPQSAWRRLTLDVIPRIPLLRRSQKYPQPYYAFVRQRTASRSYDATARLGEIRVPTLILHGKNDHLAPLALAEEMHAGIAGSQMTVVPGGHIFFFLRPKQLAEAITAFLATA
ncbi:MAG TPA: alpha/beta hydrolase [Ktedonobacterales bacterium]